MHEINIPSNFIRTDLVMEKNSSIQPSKQKKENKVIIEERIINKNKYTTILFEDITDHNHYEQVQDIFIKELKKYLKQKKNDSILIIGLGNRRSTPDSLGPTVIDHILVTRYLFLLGKVEAGYQNVAVFSPDVMGNTGIESVDIIHGIIEKINPSKIIIIDALKTNDIDHLGKVIQITDEGISPGSGIGNFQKEITKETVKKDVIAIGIPTVVNISNSRENKEDLMVTPTSIDFLIEKLSLLLGNGINISLHKNFIRQKDSK